MLKAIDFIFTKDSCTFLFDDGSEKIVPKDSDDYKKYFGEVTDKEATPVDMPVVEPIVVPEAPEPVVDTPISEVLSPEPTVEPETPDTAADEEMIPPSEAINDESNAVGNSETGTVGQ